MNMFQKIAILASIIFATSCQSFIVDSSAEGDGQNSFDGKRYSLSVECTPASASIYINQEFMGLGKFSSRFRSGIYTIDVSAEGYKSKSTTIKLLRPTTVVIDLEKITASDEVK